MVWFTPQDGPGPIKLLQEDDMGYLHVVWSNSEGMSAASALIQMDLLLRVPDG